MVKRAGLILLIAALIIGMLIFAPSASRAQDNQTPTPTDYLGAWQGYVLVTFKESPIFGKGANTIVEQALREAMSFLAPEYGAWPPYRIQIGPWNLDRTKVIVEARFDQFPRKAMMVDLLTARLKTVKELVNEGLDVMLFAPGGTWRESHEAVVQYLAQNARDWNPPEDQATK